MNLLFVNWGAKLGPHIQCAFSILTAFKYAHCFEDYFVVTDCPEYYRFFGDRVKVIPVSSEQLKEWTGEENYMFNIKIKGIAHFNQLYPEKPILFVDSDTFFYNNPERLKRLLEEKKTIMHLNEGSFRSYVQRSRTAQRIFPILKKLDLGKYKITEDTCMFNSGVLGLPPGENLQHQIKEVLDLTEVLSKSNLKIHFQEQLAFSLVLQDNYELHTASDCVGHYWGNKQVWENEILLFLAKAQLEGLTIDQIVDNLSQFNFDHPVVCKKRIMNIRLNKLARKIFPDRLKYIRDLIE